MGRAMKGDRKITINIWQEIGQGGNIHNIIHNMYNGEEEDEKTNEKIKEVRKSEEK